MGNSLGGKKTVKIMKITGETFKLKTPVKASEVVRDYPGHVVLESEAVKHYGTRAKPLEPNRELVAKRLYFLVELPKSPTEKNPRRVRSSINMSAKDRLESLMLARRSASDLSIIKPNSIGEENGGTESGGMRVKMRLPKAEVQRLMQESKDEDEAAAKILDLCMGKKGKRSNGTDQNSNGQMRWNSGKDQSVKHAREKRVSFMPTNEGEMQMAVASY